MGFKFLRLMMGVLCSQLMAVGAFAAESIYRFSISNPIQIRYRHQNLVVVIDDSGSFSYHSQTAEKIFRAFPASLLTKYDQILVTTTSTQKSYAKIFVFSPQDFLDPVAQFTKSVQVGSNGNGDERPLVRLAQLSKLPELQSFFEVPNQVLIITDGGETLDRGEESLLGQEIKALQSVFTANELGFSSKVAVLALSEERTCRKDLDVEQGVLSDFLKLQNAKIFDLCDVQTPKALVDHLQAEIQALYQFRKKLSLGIEGTLFIAEIQPPTRVLDSSIEVRLNGVSLSRESGNPNAWDFVSGRIVFGKAIDLKACHADPKCTVEISYVLGDGLK